MLYKSWEAVIRLIKNYYSIVSEVKHKANCAETLKRLTLEQMLQSLPITLAQGKAGNTYEKLLTEVWQIIYSLYWSREITKKIYI